MARVLSRSDCVEFEVLEETEADTADAVLVKIDGNKLWIPKSQIHDDSEVWKAGQTGKLIISGWIASKKGLA